MLFHARAAVHALLVVGLSLSFGLLAVAFPEPALAAPSTVDEELVDDRLDPAEQWCETSTGCTDTSGRDRSNDPDRGGKMCTDKGGGWLVCEADDADGVGNLIPGCKGSVGSGATDACREVGGGGGSGPVCNPTWSSNTAGPGWHGSGSHIWWGTHTTRTQSCTGATSASSDRVCYLQGCVDQPTRIAWDRIRPRIDRAVPEVSTSPDPESLVHVATWFWHDEWRAFTDRASHAQAPITVTLDVVPVSTNWDHGQGNFTCVRAPEPFDFDLLHYDEDPDAECNSHRYTYPSLNTGPYGEDAYEISAQVRYEFRCTVAGAPVRIKPTLCQSGGRYRGAPVGRTLLPVYELQGVLRG